MTKRLLYSILFSLLLTAGGCGASGNGEAGDGQADSLTDSIPGAEPEEPLVHISSYEDAMRWMRSQPDSASYMKGILPDIARADIGYAERLINNRHSRFLIVDKAEMTVNLYDRFGVRLYSFGMACGKGLGTKHKRGDSRTPEGFFSVEGVYDSSEWLYTDDDGNTSEVKGQFGPHFIRLAIPGAGGAIGIHGTNAPWSIGGRRSHGCIRILNENIETLAPLVEKGIPAIITPGRRDQRVNAEEGYRIVSVPSVRGGRTYDVSDDDILEAREAKSEREAETARLDSIKKISDSIGINHTPEVGPEPTDSI